MKIDPREQLLRQDVFTRRRYREILAEPEFRAAERAARDAAIAEFCATYFGDRSQRGAARGFCDEISWYVRTDWPRDKGRGEIDVRAGARRKRLFAIAQLCGGEVNRIRTIQKILAESGRF